MHLYYLTRQVVLGLIYFQKQFWLENKSYDRPSHKYTHKVMLYCTHIFVLFVHNLFRFFVNTRWRYSVNNLSGSPSTKNSISGFFLVWISYARINFLKHLCHVQYNCDYIVELNSIPLTKPVHSVLIWLLET